MAQLQQGTLEVISTSKLFPELQGTMQVSSDVTYVSVNAAVKEFDWLKTERQYFQEKYPNIYQYIDLGSCHTCTTQLKPYEIKAMAGFNYYAMREHLVNPSMSPKYDIYDVNETWEHVITCPSMRIFLDKFLIALRGELEKFQDLRHDVTQILENIKKIYT